MSLRVILLLLGLVVSGCSDALSHGRDGTPVVEAAKIGDIPPDTLALPNEDRSVKFAIIGDSGRGSVEQHEVAARMVASRQRFDYRFVLMAGDNIYEGPATPEDYRLKFAEPYQLAARGHRFALESAFVDGGINVVFSGHEHFYQRSQLQKNILYFVTGGAGSLRAGDAKLSAAIAKSYDSDNHFMLAEVTDEGFFFQAINRKGETVDARSAPSSSLRDPPSLDQTPRQYPATWRAARDTCRRRANPSQTGTRAADSRSCYPSARGTPRASAAHRHVPGAPRPWRHPRRRARRIDRKSLV